MKKENLQEATMNLIQGNSATKKLSEGVSIKEILSIDEEGIFERDYNADSILPIYYSEEIDRIACVGTAEEIAKDCERTGDETTLAHYLKGTGYTVEEFMALPGKLVMVSDTTGYDYGFNSSIYKLD